MGTIVNVISIVLGSVLGLLFKKGIPESYSRTIMQGLGLAVLLVGVSMSLQSKQVLVVVLSLVLGALTGELLNIEGGLTRLGQWLEAKVGRATGDVGRAFVTASLIYCVGAMAIMGSIEDGLNHNPRILYIKSALDGVSSVVFASTMGLGVLFSAIPVLIYQGSITLLAWTVKDYLGPAVISEMTATGGLLILGIAFNMLNITEIKVGNLLPAIFYAIPLAMLLSKVLPA
ncbi:MAG: DUF554 domain-containing protein [Desulfotomaculaceae bacterium]|nr:DUF554 domain-containing protein [Desulfotomaculaceae bacterium]